MESENDFSDAVTLVIMFDLSFRPVEFVVSLTTRFSYILHVAMI